jgi:hypothetical protein
MRVPAQTHLFVGDFNHDGKTETVLVLADHGNNYLLIAQSSGKTWRKVGLVRIGKAGVREFDGRAFVLDDQSFVAWNGQRYTIIRGPLAQYCYGYQTSEFGGVTLKLTYVGPQDEPYPGLLISSFYRLPDLGKFKTFRRKNVSYANDDLPAMWHVTVSPEELRSSILTLSQSDFTDVAEDRDGREGGITHSFSILDDASAHRPNYFEICLKGDETAHFLADLADRLEKSNADTAKVLREYAKMFGK